MLNPVMFGRNIYFLIGLLLALGVIVTIIVALWTGVNIGVWHLQRKGAEKRARQRKQLPDGRLLPPATRGLCTRCGRAGDRVYQLPSGARLCPECFTRRQLKMVTGDDEP